MSENHYCSICNMSCQTHEFSIPEPPPLPTSILPKPVSIYVHFIYTECNSPVPTKPKEPILRERILCIRCHKKSYDPLCSVCEEDTFYDTFCELPVKARVLWMDKSKL